MKEKNLELERLVFFSDAIVAIAITLLALDLKIDHLTSGHLTFADLGDAWQKFVSFFLSFFIIAIFWKIHHEFYVHIRKIDHKLLWYNIGWLMFIVILPFTTSLISAHLFDTAAIFAYCINVLMITLAQNLIWDYASARPDYLKENTDAETIRNHRIACNVAMINALVAVTISFFSPLIAFIILFTRLPMFGLTAKYYKRRRAFKK
jgi:uncharacterized membrane protein